MNPVWISLWTIPVFDDSHDLAGFDPERVLLSAILIAPRMCLVIFEEISKGRLYSPVNSLNRYRFESQSDFFKNSTRHTIFRDIFSDQESTLNSPRSLLLKREVC